MFCSNSKQWVVFVVKAAPDGAHGWSAWVASATSITRPVNMWHCHPPIYVSHLYCQYCTVLVPIYMLCMGNKCLEIRVVLVLALAYVVLSLSQQDQYHKYQCQYKLTYMPVYQQLLCMGAFTPALCSTGCDTNYQVKVPVPHI